MDGSEVKRIRKDAGFKTQKALADAMNTTVNTVSRWEANQLGLSGTSLRLFNIITWMKKSSIEVPLETLHRGEK